MKLNLDYLDVLYAWKSEADKLLEDYELKYNDYSWDKDDYDEKIKYDVRLVHYKSIADRCKNAIRVYISHHSN